MASRTASLSDGGPDTTEPVGFWLIGDADAIGLAERMVEILRALPGVRSLTDQDCLEAAAWASIALRRGRCPDGRRVDLNDLEFLGLSPDVLQAIWVVGGPRRQVEEGQRKTILAISPTIGMLWTVFWIAMAEQARAGSRSWKTIHSRAERETAHVLHDLPDLQRRWLRDRLARARWRTTPAP